MLSHEVSGNANLDRSIGRLLSGSTALAAGFVGMLAQLVWMRILIQWFGTSAVTIASVLAACLAGLAIGAWIFRQDSERYVRWLGPSARQPGWLLLLAAVGVFEGLVLFSIGDWYLLIIRSVLPSSAALLATAIVTLVPVNIALGGVLPSLVRFNRNESTRSVGALYAAETVGGAVGALAAGFLLIHTFGLAATLLLAGIIGSVFGAVSIVYTARGPSKTDEDETCFSFGASDVVEPIARPTRMIVAIFLAGVASLSMEIIWQRALILLVGTDTHSYMIVAVSYLVGVALGSYLCGWFASRDRVSMFCWLQLGVGITSLLALTIFVQLASGPGQRWLSDATSGSEVVGKRFLASFVLLLLPGCLTGASFPAAVSMLVDWTGSKAKATGLCYAVIAVGNIIGVLLAGFLLIPMVGLQSALVLLVGIALIAAWLASAGWKPIFYLATSAVFVAGFYHAATQEPLGLAELPTDQEIAFYREGPVNTVSVVVDKDESIDGKISRRMVVDGIVIGENVGGVDEKQQVLAHLPLLIQAMSSPQSSETLQAISIGLGTGILAGEMAVSPLVGNLTCVELSPAVIDASMHFADDNHQLAINPKVTIIQGDGIHFLRQTDEVFDCIVSDGKSRPGHSGNVAFFASDYYQLAADRLTDSGTFVQWVPLESSQKEVQTILKTFATNFPRAYIAIAPPDSIYLVGRKQPIQWNDALCENYLQRATSVYPYGWRSSDDVLGMAWLEALDVAQSLPADIDVNSLNRPTLEQFALDIHRPEASEHKSDNLLFLESCLQNPSHRIMAFDSGPDERASNVRAACLNLVRAGQILANPVNIDLSQAAAYHQQALRTLPRLSRGLDVAERLLQKTEELSESLSVKELGALLQQTASLVPTDADLQTMIGNALSDRKLFDKAAGCFFRASKLRPAAPQPNVDFARCLIELKKFRAAVRPLKKALKLQPDHEEARQLLRVVELNAR